MMKIRPLVIAFLCVCSTFAFPAQAQDRELSLDIGYPLPIGDTFLSQYDGRVGGSVLFGQPLGRNVVLEVGVQYNRLNLDLSDIVNDENAGRTISDVYTPRIGFAYYFEFSRRFKIVPTLGLSYSHFSFEYSLGENPDSKTGYGVWGRISPRYMFNTGWGVSAYLDYRGTFMIDTGEASNTPFNREYHALVFGVGGIYRF